MCCIYGTAGPSWLKQKMLLATTIVIPRASLCVKMLRNTHTYILLAYFNPNELLDVVRIYFIKRNFFKFPSFVRNCVSFSLFSANQQSRTVQRSVIIGNTAMARWTWCV